MLLGLPGFLSGLLGTVLGFGDCSTASLFCSLLVVFCGPLDRLGEGFGFGLGLGWCFGGRGVMWV
eukprot:1019183-Amorphochlora_amoeboformis.AAC.1